MWLKQSILCITSLTTLLVAFSSVAEVPQKSPAVASELSLKKIMSDPDWIGNSPDEPSWSVDGKSLFYQQKATGHTHNNQFQIQLADKSTRQLQPKDALYMAAQQAVQNQAGTQGVFSYQGDVYWVDYASAEIKALTADEEAQTNASFASSTVISYLQGNKVFLYDLTKSLSRQIADFKTEQDPESEKTKDYLQQSQPRLLNYLKQKEAEKQFQKNRNKLNSLSTSKTWYLGTKVEIRTFRLSPDANWLVLGTIEKDLEGTADHMPEFVTMDGYVNDRKVRPLVGTSSPTNESFYLVDLSRQKKYQLDTDNLPGINDDPLEKLKKNAAKKIGYKYKPQQGPRAIYAYNWMPNQGVEWSDNSQQVAMLLFSYDNKDRWIVNVDVNQQKLKTLHWMSDEAWVNDWTFNQFGWLPDNETLYYLSEEDGYSHIYLKKGSRRARQLTEGKFEVSDLTVSKAGDKIYFRANKKHPGIYEIYRVSTKNGDIQALTNMGGVNDYVLSPSEQQLIVRHSQMTKPAELYLKQLDSSAAAVQLTNTASDAFKAYSWQQPEIVEVPSSHIKRSIYSRFYKAKNEQKAGNNNKKPAVVFVHGAGYLQNSHQGWSGYFREYMFHNMLTSQGYVVLDMDYRASKGYGRDWRTAIYQNMGTPELQDLTDGVNWLVKNANVDPQRVGVYGGSYGGFMTFMALFKAPELFAAGAALRPVTDWAHYNHGYTSNILNTPQVDPDAYQRSSPIEFAEGLNKPLLIAHGMVDDNVFFKDSVRLVQRLIELEKTEYFETAIYPVEPHGFKQPSSWLDEYTRIYQLFEKHLN